MRYLVGAGEAVRAARTRTGAREVSELDGAEQVRFAFDDPATWESAFDGVDRLFVMRPPAITDTGRLIRPVVEFARAPCSQCATSPSYRCSA